MKTAREIENNMPQFYGCEPEEKTRMRMFGKVLLTPGAQYVEEAAEANWLMVMIASHIPSIMAGERFGFARLTVNDNGSADFVLSDGNRGGNVYARQHIPATDFPMKSIKFYVAFDGSDWTIMLPSEY